MSTDNTIPTAPTAGAFAMHNVEVWAPDLYLLAEVVDNLYEVVAATISVLDARDCRAVEHGFEHLCGIVRAMQARRLTDVLADRLDSADHLASRAVTEGAKIERVIAAFKPVVMEFAERAFGASGTDALRGMMGMMEGAPAPPGWTPSIVSVPPPGVAAFDGDPPEGGEHA